ncbi:uncharacterized protein CBL_14532 [Carabus blaptoides fortunei]
MIIRHKSALYVILGVFIITAIVVGTYVGASSSNVPNRCDPNWSTIDCTQNYIKYKAGVVTNGIECANIGSDILKRGGSAADAAIAALFCEGVAQPQSMGLGGGFLLTIYIRKTGEVKTLDAREVAPKKATVDMYDGNATLSSEGALSIAVPGELMGYWELHQKYGKLDWKELVQPTIDLCREGHYVTKYLARVFKSKQTTILKYPDLSAIFIDPITGDTWKEGQRIKRIKLAETLEIIAKEGAKALYNGTLTKLLIDDIQDLGGILTEEDMHNYQPRWKDPVVTKLYNNLTLYSSPLPGSGVILTFILNILNGFIDTKNSWSDITWQRIVESFKFGYGRRTELGDIDGLDELLANLTNPRYAYGIRGKIFYDRTFQNPEYYGANYSLTEDHGTAHISVLAPNGDAVSVTSTINLILGSKIRSKSTGIIMNDEMDDFSAPNITNAFGLPPSPANYINPGKRPLSSMCPTIIVDKDGDVRLVVGAAGGSKITTAVATVTIRNTMFEEILNSSIIAKRLHHQLFPMAIQFEDEFNNNIVNELSKIGHKHKFVNPSDGFAAVTGLARQCGTVFGEYDIRRQGSVSLF